jgi:hypothetical protein
VVSAAPAASSATAVSAGFRRVRVTRLRVVFGFSASATCSSSSADKLIPPVVDHYGSADTNAMVCSRITYSVIE